MSKSWFKDNKQAFGKPMTRGGQMRDQMARDAQKGKEITQQRGYTTMGIRPKSK